MPRRRSIATLRVAAARCRGCDLWERATQTVFGAGPPRATIVLVGEQPGDAEDRAGAPFVGPAGALLDRALDAAGIDRAHVYVTNAVKHFKWEPAGKRRIHKKPTAREIAACRPWLDAEIAVVRPHAIVCLGATAAQALLGAAFRVSRDRGRFVESSLAPRVLATTHPAAVLRAPGDDERRQAMAQLVRDLRRVAQACARDARSLPPGVGAKAERD
jgi:DNA polymerase